jgi:hypothetical protein
VAVRKKTQRKTKKTSVGLIFWPFFFILIIGLFMVNRDLIRNTLEETQVPQRLFNRPPSEQNPPPGFPPDMPEEPPSPEIPNNAVEPPPAVPEDSHQPAPAGDPERPRDAEPEAPGENLTPPPAGDQEPEQPPPQVPAPQTPIPQAPVSVPPAAAEPSRQSPPPQRETRERTLYFIRIDPDGAILRTQALRRLPVSDSPMVDALRALLQGPTAEEDRRDIKNFIPQGARILSAIVRGNTAYISFSEEFQYNTYGVEGYLAQLQQIVWTATEFPNVNNVQFLIEGRRIDFLGESIWIGSPIGRE